MKIVHLFPNGNVEVGSPKLNRRTGQYSPGYRLVPAYSSIVSETSESVPLTRANWRGMAERDGDKLKFHKTREEALAAFRS